MTYRVAYSPATEKHMRHLTRSQQVMVVDRVRELLALEPTQETRHRKKLRANALAPWELRIGAIRVFYDVVTEPQQVVVILAIGVKEHNVLRIAGEVIEL